MLNQIVPNRARRSGIGQHLQDGIDLVETGKDKCFPTLCRLKVNEAPYDVEENLSREHRPPFWLIGPQVCNAKLAFDVGIACSTVMASVERQKSRSTVLKARRHRNVVLIQCKMDKGATLERQQWLIRRWAIFLVLEFCVLEG